MNLPEDAVLYGCQEPQIVTTTIFHRGEQTAREFYITPGIDYALAPGEILALPGWMQRRAHVNAGAN